jgi:hypothetical protein
MREVELAMSLRIAALESVSRRVKCLARWEELLGVVSMSAVELGGLLTVVSQMPGWAGGSVREGSMEMDGMGGIWRDVETVGLKVTEAMREDEMEVNTDEIAWASDERESSSLYMACVGECFEMCFALIDMMSSHSFQT